MHREFYRGTFCIFTIFSSVPRAPLALLSRNKEKTRVNIYSLITETFRKAAGTPHEITGVHHVQITFRGSVPIKFIASRSCFSFARDKKSGVPVSSGSFEISAWQHKGWANFNHSHLQINNLQELHVSESAFEYFGKRVFDVNESPSLSWLVSILPSIKPVWRSDFSN